MYALLLATLLGAGQDTTRPATGAGAGDRERGRDAATATPLDGTWPVVVYERNGTAVDGATARTATFRGNTLSFGMGRSGSGTGTGAGGTGAAADRPAGGDRAGAGSDAAAFTSLRVEFGPRGTVRVTELGS